MPTARIYQRPKSSTQSGRARTDQWMFEFVAAEGQRPDPLTGWAGSDDTRNQIRLSFPTRDAAIEYAEREGYSYTLVPAPERRLKLQAYADNFK